jgi:hypothetical protein
MKGSVEMEAAIVFRWVRAAAGREKLAFEVFGEALSFFGKKAAEGLCQAPVAYIGPSGNTALIVGGERASLVEMAAGGDFSRLNLKAGYAVPDLTYEIMLTGADAVRGMGLWAAVGSELGLM